MDTNVVLMSQGNWQDPRSGYGHAWPYNEPPMAPSGHHGLQSYSSYPMSDVQYSPEASMAYFGTLPYSNRPVDQHQLVMGGYHVNHESPIYPRQQAPGPYETTGVAQQYASGPSVPYQAQSSGGTKALQHPVGPFTPAARQYNMHPVHVRTHDLSHNAATPILNNPTRRTPVVPSSALFQLPKTALPPSPQQPRGPPRKPKRSGHAVWVGNIPMGTDIEMLKDHFSKDATTDIESVFLMAESNCAFVNYTTQEACVKAVDRFNHKFLGNVRLLCRLRMDAATSEATKTPNSTRQGSTPTASTTTRATSSSVEVNTVTELIAGLGITDGADTETSDAPPSPQPEHSVSDRPKHRYFIVKSLTKEDLQESLMKGTWETQAHNQTALHDAYSNAEHVYLIFSVNKSGEYFGYGRMSSSPFDTTQQQSPVCASGRTAPADDSNVKHTSATETAPRGYIISDTTRGTLFWEAENIVNNIVSSNGPSPPNDNDRAKSRPFQVEWLSVRRVPFQRTKGLRNTWNANKEVKVARDGTELETNVGEKLVGLFHETLEDRKKSTR